MDGDIDDLYIPNCGRIPNPNLYEGVGCEGPGYAAAFGGRDCVRLVWKGFASASMVLG